MVERDGIVYQPLCSKIYRVCAVAAEPRAALLAKGQAHALFHLIAGALLGAFVALYAALEPWYAAEPARIRYVEYPGVGHFLTPELDTESCQAMVAWFQRWLP